MKQILIVYGTTDGHTRKIAEVLAENLRAERCSVDLLDAGGSLRRLSPEGYDGVIVAASVHIGSYQSGVTRWVRTYAAMLNDMPTAFLSVCLAVLEPNAKTRREVANILERFFARTGWQPLVSKPIGGAVRYTHDGWLKRRMMKRIVGKAGGSTDTTRDHEYTDWNDLRSFALEFTNRLRAGAPAPVRSLATATMSR
ncbi:MAG: protoporphyrinogen oxidase [Gemmatimonadetes bacterium]|nr:MAG: protoporphyrinogen oxidase [Gemmatimonadota bacterium]